MKTKTEILEARGFIVVKANHLIQKSRFNLSLEEQKIILYLISKIKPEDQEILKYTFSIKDFCQICGFNDKSGGNYAYIKQTLKGLRDKSVWIKMNDKREAILAWIDHVIIDENSGNVEIKINEIMKPFLLQLKEQFTQYELIYTLGMKSRYSIRLYELLKSYEYLHGHTFEIEELKSRMNAEHYKAFPDFNRNALSIALREINSLTDLDVNYSIIREGRRFAKIKFWIKLKKDLDRRMEVWKQIELRLDGNKKQP
jgi:plasmid replication initiation protein